ncbi:MAG TPA: glycosyltransferase family 39 protein [Dyella sp.]|uniref:ArnT family glycosyltransferase n=1 Tax=Dyella sp. TaxID=1869338 RepID=UPI002CC2A8F5|nr:glycosyltransferase family 39 protein [Dyella sp.]HTV86159.1 glycosyltransferase family 39 protein [Dyella sp.]
MGLNSLLESIQFKQWLWLPCWLSLAMIAIFQHGPMPMYSTRTLSVAWEMWHRHSLIVPYLNGVPYSEKAPLLLWLIQIGWWVAGVNDVWPRLLEVMLGGMELTLLWLLARRLFPSGKSMADASPWILAALAYGFLFGLQIMYEVLLADCVLAALLALAPTTSRQAPRFVLFAVATGLGMLAKGPVMLLHVAFPWLLGPLWHDWARASRRNWYIKGAIAVLAAFSMLAVWVLCATWLGGEAYRQQLLVHQTAGRIVRSFAHAEPFWWYMAALPALLFPFVLWPRLWVALGKLRPPFAPGYRFVACWLVPVVLAFSLISGKQPYYLLPEYPGFALLFAAATHREDVVSPAHRWLRPWPLAMASFLLCLGLASLPYFIHHISHPRHELAQLAPISPLLAAAFCFLGIYLLVPARNELVQIAVAGLLGALIANSAFTIAIWPQFNIAPAADELAKVASEGRPIANMQTYDGQFSFLGRLTQPVSSLHGTAELLSWVNKHPDGVIISYPSHLSDAAREHVLYAQSFRGVWLALWSAKTITNWREDQWGPLPSE